MAEFRDLDRNEEQYRALFQGLGYELVHHGQGFYYFRGGNSLTTQRLRAVTLFTLILFQDLEDKKFQEANRAWERMLLTRVFGINELPHFETPQRRSLMFHVGVTPETLHEKVLRPMARLGMLEMIGSEQFQFRSPIYRFVDLCMQFANEDWEPVQPATAGENETSKSPIMDGASATWMDDEDEEGT